eukprot:TRINITY_DN4423_c0_g1_i8.p1 TRINITY_DN4423_c0_g1~~TRINITY_DN4423_c0_g1_i8.p1  ORF type:complete len:299 (-),score=36.10 TRINITY_DN4423_c0_g1_i8:82-978(-)
MPYNVSYNQSYNSTVNGTIPWLWPDFNGSALYNQTHNQSFNGNLSLEWKKFNQTWNFTTQNKIFITNQTNSMDQIIQAESTIKLLYYSYNYQLNGTQVLFNQTWNESLYINKTINESFFLNATLNYNESLQFENGSIYDIIKNQTFNGSQTLQSYFNESVKENHTVLNGTWSWLNQIQKDNELINQTLNGSIAMTLNGSCIISENITYNQSSDKKNQTQNETITFILAKSSIELFSYFKDVDCWMICAIIEALIILIAIVIPYMSNYQITKKQDYEQSLNDQAKIVFAQGMEQIANQA